MDPRHPKGLFFRGQAQIRTEEFDAGVKTLQFLAEKVAPGNADFKAELERARATRKKFLQSENAKYSKMF